MNWRRKGDGNITKCVAARRRLALQALLALALCLPGLLTVPAAGQENDAPGPALSPLEAADEAARALDYDMALQHLSTAIAAATEPQAVLLRRREALYERYLGMSWLLQQAASEPGRLVGMAVTRDGRTLAGQLRLLELGVVPGARIGTRLLDRGSLRLMVDDDVRELAPEDLALIEVTWTPPGGNGGLTYWSTKSIHMTLHTGEVVEGRPTWVLPISHVAMRVEGAEQDTAINVLPASDRTPQPGDLVAEIILLGAPGAPRTVARPEGNP